jgi:hypothetical protein
MEILRAAKLCLIMEYFEDKWSLIKTNVGRWKNEIGSGEFSERCAHDFPHSVLLLHLLYFWETILCQYIQLALNSIIEQA